MKITPSLTQVPLVAVLVGCAFHSAHAAQILISDDFSQSTVSDTGLQFGDLAASGPVGTGSWYATTSTNWTISGGALSNAGGGTAAQDEGSLARLIDISSISDTSLDQLSLSVSFNTANTSEKLFVHLRGYILGTDPAASAGIVNSGATNGNAWNDAVSTTDWTIYNLNSGQLNNHYSDYSSAGWAVQLSSGVSGNQNFEQTFDMSGYAAEANNIAGFDYLGVFFTRDATGTSPAVSISEVTLTAVPEPSSAALLGLGAGWLMLRRRR